MLRQEEKELFQSLIGGEFINFALVEGSFMGQRAAFIAAVNRDGKVTLITPLAVFLREEDLNHCRGPEDEALAGN